MKRIGGTGRVIGVLVMLIWCRCLEGAHVLDRVVAIGASATDGFRAVAPLGEMTRGNQVKVNLGDALRACIVREGGSVEAYGDPFFFMAPLDVGPALLDRAVAAKPTLVIAIDFVFWFGYGANGVDGKPITDEAARLALLDEGLRLLEQVDCPLLVGDFPDMSEAVGGMLASEQMPKTETLKALNERVATWAKSRGNVVVLPLSELLGAMKRGEEVRVGTCCWPTGCAGTLLQADRLHPTCDGLICLSILALHHAKEAPLGIQNAELQLDAAASRASLMKRLAARAPAAPKGTTTAPTSSSSPPAATPGKTSSVGTVGERQFGDLRDHHAAGVLKLLEKRSRFVEQA